MSTTDATSGGLQAVHLQWAMRTIKKLRLLHPELQLALYRIHYENIIHIAECEDSKFAELKTWFNKNLKPVTCNIKLSRISPPIENQINEPDDYESDVWLKGEPLSVHDFNVLLSLAEPNLPRGSIDFDNQRQVWIFRTFSLVDTTATETVLRAAVKIGITEPVEIVTIDPPSQGLPSPQLPTDRSDLTLITSNQYAMQAASSTLRSLIHQDEDDWRSFLTSRQNQLIVPEEPLPLHNFSCLYDVENCGDSRLSELLTIYDCVNIIPELSSLDWLTKHRLSLTDLQELIRLNRVKIILPYSANLYPQSLIDAMAEVDPQSIILSRSLAAKSIIRGQKKEPLLYAPLTSDQRAAVLQAISKISNNVRAQPLLKSYGQLISRQHDVFMMRGATASLNVGVGAHLGEMFFNLTKKDARLELMTCGAAVEWAQGLGVSYIPRDFGGFDETHNSQIVASYLGKTRFVPRDPVANRMHSVTDGLLSLSEASPLDVALNFNSTQITRFRNVASQLMVAPAGADIIAAVDQINADVKAFERRAERLAPWRLESLFTGMVSTAITQSLEMAPVASIGAAWLYDVLSHQIPTRVQDELGDAKNMLLGLATGSSIDTVVVSRSRRAISRN
ncbi:hypothetical protein [Methylophilus luteus]|uniref:Uncharacterized protein n=1 Tax=Methylophilus luteus TaxID=640108 RepID=A0ABW3F625_9PROT